MIKELNELTLKFNPNVCLYKGLKEYLEALNGIDEIKTDIDNEELYIKYDHNIIKLEILLKEIEVYLDILKIPSLLGFDKHSQNNNELYKTKIKDICCEYCLMGFIEELLLLPEIVKLQTDYDDIENNKNFIINIEYNKNLISKEKIDELIKEINE